MPTESAQQALDILRVSDIPGGHADSFVTSIALHFRPEEVRQDLIQDPKNDPVNWDDPILDFSVYLSTGVIGDPTHSSAELGTQLWDALVDRVAEIIRDSFG
jgi:creatinine amidohydrolase